MRLFWTGAHRFRVADAEELWTIARDAPEWFTPGGRQERPSAEFSCLWERFPSEALISSSQRPAVNRKPVTVHLPTGGAARPVSSEPAA